ncbi:MAG: TIGR00282 family metallophosphoesterase [Candidatus Spechtbacterales bacterium]
MRILFFGDVFGRPGRDALKKEAPKLKEKHKADFVIANIENIAHGSGITKSTVSELSELDIFNAYTSGDHIWDTPDAEAILKEKKDFVLRPANFGKDMSGSGFEVISRGAKRILVINLLGQVFIKREASNPFIAADEILNKYTLDHTQEGREYVDAIFVDFHAEATSEKRALGFYLDGRVSAVVGTHTHVPTLDAQILPKGTAYISDAGMVGAYNSIIGLEKDPLITQYLTGEVKKKEIGSDKRAEIGAVLVETNKEGMAVKIEHLRKVVKIY